MADEPGSQAWMKRAAGVLLHVTSLPGSRLGPAAFRFVDWLVEAGQTWWQILPLGPPNRLGSPYEAASAFAGWPALLARPTARVSTAAAVDFAERHAAWIDGWVRYAGVGALADQVRFEREWSALRSYANDRGVRILGDMPLYVSMEGADRADRPELFVTDRVAGCPPDYFSADGQLWGNPLYRWPQMRAENFAWWIARLRRGFELADAIRIDHFRGLVAYWATPASARTARDGRWQRGPGRGLLAAVRDSLGEPALVAEDLGVITPAVERLRVEFGLPGMAVLQFMVSNGPVQSSPLWRQVDRVLYPGTHDNATTVQWLGNLDEDSRRHLRESLDHAGIDTRLGGWSVVELAYAAPAKLAMVAAQDLLELGASARMNTPAKRTGNWRWQLAPGQLTSELAMRLRALTEAAGRI